MQTLLIVVEAILNSCKNNGMVAAATVIAIGMLSGTGGYALVAGVVVYALYAMNGKG